MFQPYTWDAKTEANAVLDGRNWRSARIPLTVFISGPTAGGPFAAGDTSPRAVNLKWWETVCPPTRRKVINVEEEHAEWGVTEETEGRELVERWSKKLNELDDPCVEVSGDTIFSFPSVRSAKFSFVKVLTCDHCSQSHCEPASALYMAQHIQLADLDAVRMVPSYSRGRRSQPS